ncbi:MAG: pentapeptide repeat-containing protein [Gammaproteobacteria bacterium]|nr:pentapeptide repeat-containing protein [Gammaproteobacteria bacterium]
MAVEGWSITYPKLVGFGARALAVPGRGNVLCASAFMPFRLQDGDLLEPAVWYEAVREFGGEGSIPDTVSPLPRAELLLLGGVKRVDGDERLCDIRCGAVEVELLLRPDEESTDLQAMDADAAVWHETDNPGGRGGPDDRRRPLIVDRNHPGRPVWLGSTSYLHPARQRRLGEPGEDATAGWPGNASSASFHDAHESFWADGLFPRDPLRLTGLVDVDIDLDLPPFRIGMAAAKETEAEPYGDWFLVETRIHSVSVIATAGVGAVLWRGSIDLGADILGESVVALVAGVEDAEAPARGVYELGEVVVDRLLEPGRALDDRPLLPESLHDRVEVPFQGRAEGSPLSARLETAKDWAFGETGLDQNPFEGQDLPGKEIAELAQSVAPDDGEVDVNRLSEVAAAVFDRSKELHEQAGFDEEARPEERSVVVRGDALEDEVARRLDRPYQSAQETTIAANLTQHPTGVDAEDVLERLASARLESPQPPLYWPALEFGESVRFGEAVLEWLGKGDPVRHIDVSGAQVGDEPALDPRVVAAMREEEVAAAVPEEEPDFEFWHGEKPPPLDTPGTTGTLTRAHSLRGRRIDGLLAEETGWRGIRFEQCTFADSSFAQGEIENCEFVECSFEHFNVSGVTFSDCRFESCAITELEAAESAWKACELADCTLENCSFNDAGMRDVTFRGGSWRHVVLTEGMFMNVSVFDTKMEDTSFNMMRAAYWLLDGVSMERVVGMGRGFLGAELRNLKLQTCGFTLFKFDESSWENVRASESGFTNGLFTEAAIAPACEFWRCDLTGAAFIRARLGGARLIECSLTGSAWSGADAKGAWFLGSSLRGVDFADARLAGAVFCDADLNGTVFLEQEVIGADFSGTLRGD